MLALYRVGMAIKTSGTANLPDPILRTLHRRGDVNDRFWHSTAQGPGLVEMNRWHIAELRTPLANEMAFGVMILPLFDRVVDPDRVDRCTP